MWMMVRCKVFVDDSSLQAHGRLLEQLSYMAKAYQWLKGAIQQRLKACFWQGQADWPGLLPHGRCSARFGCWLAGDVARGILSGP